MQLTARRLVKDRCVCITGSVMDLYSRRSGKFENSRSSGMWPAEIPSVASLFSPHSPALPLLSAVDIARTPTYALSLPRRPFMIPRSPAAPPQPLAWRPK